MSFLLGRFVFLFNALRGTNPDADETFVTKLLSTLGCAAAERRDSTGGCCSGNSCCFLPIFFAAPAILSGVFCGVCSELRGAFSSAITILDAANPDK